MTRRRTPFDAERQQFAEEWKRSGRWFTAWFVFCAVLAVAFLVALVWIGIRATS